MRGRIKFLFEKISAALSANANQLTNNKNAAFNQVRN